jgi:hypothetical protein
MGFSMSTLGNWTKGHVVPLIHSILEWTNKHNQPPKRLYKKLTRGSSLKEVLESLIGSYVCKSQKSAESAILPKLCESWHVIFRGAVFFLGFYTQGSLELPRQQEAVQFPAVAWDASCPGLSWSLGYLNTFYLLGATHPRILWWGLSEGEDGVDWEHWLWCETDLAEALTSTPELSKAQLLTCEMGITISPLETKCATCLSWLWHRKNRINTGNCQYHHLYGCYVESLTEESFLI